MTEREISVAEAARKLGVTLTHLYALLWAAKLKGRKVERQWRVSVDAVEARLSQRGAK